MTDDKTAIAQLELLDLIINNSKGIIWAIDHDYCLLYANRAYQNALVAAGGKEMSIGQSVLSDEYPKEFLDFWKDNYDKCFNDKHFSIESEMPWTDGIHFIENSLNPIKNVNGKIIGLVVTSLDISERKQVEQALKVSEEKLQITDNDFKRAQTIAHIGHWKWYLKTNEVVWSDEMFNIFGIDKNSYTGRLGDIIAKVIHPDDLHIVLPSNANEFSEKKSIEYRIILPDKTIRYILAIAGETKFDKNGSILFLNGIAQDITEHKHIEQALKESEQKYRLLSENITDGVSLFESNKVKYVSEGYLKMFGFDKQEIENISLQDIFSFIHADDKIYIKETIENAHKNQIKEFRYNYRVKNKNGAYIWVEDSINAEFDNFGNHFRSVIHSRNITEQKQAEFKIQLQNEELKKLNADKDRFLTILGHDLKSPFNSILGFLDLLTQNIRKYDIDKIEKQINIVNSSAKNTFKLLEDILLWVRANSGKIPFEPQKLNFGTICNEVVENLKLTANTKNITINHFATDEINIFADINMLNTVLRNLVSNSIKFTNKSGRIDIYAEKNHKIVTITISDNGIGIELDTLNKLFDISQKTTTDGTEKEKGTGLGLLLCKEFVEKHSGKIWVESILGKGSDFKFTMPLCND